MFAGLYDVFFLVKQQFLSATMQPTRTLLRVCMLCAAGVKDSAVHGEATVLEVAKVRLRLLDEIVSAARRLISCPQLRAPMLLLHVESHWPEVDTLFKILSWLAR